MDELEAYLDGRMPDSESLRKSVDKFSQMDLTKIPISDLNEMLHESFPLLTYTEQVRGSGYYVFRAQRNLNNSETPHYNISRIEIAPIGVAPLGRANYEHDPIFYACHKPEIALFESCQDVTEEERFAPQYFTVGVWRVKQNHLLRLAPLLDNEEVMRVRSDARKVVEMSSMFRPEILSSQKVIEGTRIIAKFFADQFAKFPIKSRNEYKISAFFATNVRRSNAHTNVEFDGILYPSVAYRYKSDNIAIFPRSLHKLEVVKCFAGFCYNFNFDTTEFVNAITADGEVLENGDIIWKERVPSMHSAKIT
jgi:RES domain